MFSVLRRIPTSRLALFGLFQQSQDVVKTPGYEGLERKYKGMEALQRLFVPDEYGELSKEMATAVHMSAAATLIGGICGAISQGRDAFQHFVENNQATQFRNQFDAKRTLQDTMTVAIGKGGVKWAFRIGGFTTVFIFLHTFIRVYRGEPGVLEYLGAGIITGGLFKLNLGIKGVIAGSAVGGFLGFLGGAASMALLYLTGYTIDDIEQTQYELHAWRNEAVRNAMKQQMAEDYENARMLSDKEEKLNHEAPLESIPDSPQAPPQDTK
ncbi:RPII140-upstream gene protein [Diachasmimorpha longicaudata]|uniref:RPII140-upstream gene protein n=1 Tax=Diachasmimorpha longicaudata TaxID=58733 RepID=UPI0030B91B4E